jgi:transposase-like protein
MMEKIDTKVWYNKQTGGVKMERIPNSRYTKEFREESVKLITEGGLSVVEAGRRLSLPT